MFNYTCLNPIAGVGLDLFSDDYKKVDDLAGADAALVRSAAMHDLDLPDSLLAVARAGAGVNNIPLDKCADKGIVVFNTPGANANGVKELVFAGMLYASRDIVGGIDWCLANQNDDNIAKTAEKQKKNFAGTEISGKKLGVIGLGLEEMQRRNIEKAKILYDFLDESKLFKGTVRKEDRSLMNVPFVTGDKDMDAKFVKEATEAGFVNLKGHRTVGGMRASIYNAMPKEGVEKLVEFMKKFEKENA